MTDDTPIADGLCYAAPATPTPPPQQDAVVACRQLGLGAPPTSGYKYDATGGSGSIHMDDLRCTGAETMLTSCSQATYHNCGKFNSHSPTSHVLTRPVQMLTTVPTCIPCRP